MKVFENKERTVTGLALLGVVFIIGFIDNFFMMWLVFGAIYLLAFKEAEKLFGVEQDGLFFYAVGLWLLAGIYPYGDDLFVLAGVAYASMIAYDKEREWRDFFPFIYPTAGILFVFTMYQEYGVCRCCGCLLLLHLPMSGRMVSAKA